MRIDRTVQVANIALRNVMRHKSRTALTLAAIAVGVTSIILSGGFVFDMFSQLREAVIHSQLGHVQIARHGYFSSGSRSPESHLISRIEETKSQVAATEGVKDVMARLNFSGLLNNGRTDLPVVAEGVEPDKEAALSTYMTIVQGSHLSDRDVDGILIGEGLAKSLQVSPGSLVTLLASASGGGINTLESRVVGIFRTFSQDFDARGVRIPLKAAQDLLLTSGANLLVVSLQDTDRTDAIARTLRDAAIPEGLDVRTWNELSDFYRSTVALYARQFGVLQIIIFIMVVLGVINAINMSVLERVGEFGTMAAIGYGRADIRVLVTTESAWLGVIGSFLGVCIGIALALGISKLGIPMPPPPNSSSGYTARILVVPSVVASAFAVGFLATVFAALLPARRVSRIPVAQALRENV